MKLFWAGVATATVAWLAALSMIDIPEYTIIMHRTVCI